MAQTLATPYSYYAQPGPMTDPGQHAHLFDELPAEIRELVEVVQGLLLHVYWAERHSVTLSDERQQENQPRQKAQGIRLATFMLGEKPGQNRD